MIVDWHAHVYPPELARERRWGGITPLTIENLLEAHERAGVDLCVVSNTIHYLRYKSKDESLAFLRRWNEYGAEIQQKYKDRIVVFTSTLPCGGAPFLRELERVFDARLGDFESGFDMRLRVSLPQDCLLLHFAQHSGQLAWH